MAVDQSARVLNASDPLVSAAPPPLDMSKLQDVSSCTPFLPRYSGLHTSYAVLTALSLA